jgi:hypothetical protein
MSGVTVHYLDIVCDIIMPKPECSSALSYLGRSIATGFVSNRRPNTVQIVGAPRLSETNLLVLSLLSSIRRAKLSRGPEQFR